jgi:hypothetical protein
LDRGPQRLGYRHWIRNFLAVGRVSVALLSLEMKRLIRQLPDKLIVKNN